MGGGTVQKVNIDTRESVGREWERAEGKRQGIKDGGEKSKTYRKQEMEDYLLTITCLLTCLIETIYSVLWMENLILYAVMMYSEERK